MNKDKSEYDNSLSGSKIAVLVESKYISEEIEAYRSRFEALGASVDFVSRLFYNDTDLDDPNWQPPVFYSDVDPNGKNPLAAPTTLSITDKNKDFSQLNLEDYAAVIMSANYVSVRLRYSDENLSSPNARSLVKSPPAVKFLAGAMQKKNIVKGVLCHGLWMLTPHPEILKGRHVTCHKVVMADIINAGAEIVFDQDEGGLYSPKKVVVDDDLITGYSKNELTPFIDSIIETIVKRI